jgi:cytoskeletal protein RodZ
MDQGGALVTTLIIVIVLLIGIGGGYWLGYRNHNTNTPNSNTTTNQNNTSTDNQNSSNASTSSACNNLTLSKGTSEGAAGTMYWHAVVTNNGSSACQLSGYPVAYLLDGQSKIISSTGNSLYKPVAVKLAANGGKAHIVLGIANADNFDSSTTVCTDKASTKLRLYLPGLTDPLETSFGESACQGFTATALQPGA